MNDMNDMNEELHRLLNEADRLVDRSEFRKAIDICRYILIRYQDDMTTTEKAHVHGCLGELLLMTGGRVEGRMHVETALRLDPDGHRWHYLLGCIYSAEKEWYEGREELRKALDGSPYHKSYLSALGDSEIACGNIEEGLSYLYRALELSTVHGKGSVPDPAIHRPAAARRYR